MTIEWNRLLPHRPLDAGDRYYVRRPVGSGEDLAERIATAGSRLVAVIGAVGIGKSTELSASAALLRKQFVVVESQLDLFLDMHAVTPDQVMRTCATRFLAAAESDLGLAFSTETKDLVTSAGSSGHDALVAVARDARRTSKQGRLALLFDGLEKAPADMARAVVSRLVRLRDELAEDDVALVFVAPYELVLGGGGHELQAGVDYFHAIRALPVFQMDGAEAGCEFLVEVVRQRIGAENVSGALADVLLRAARLSGGVPRAFLQLVRSAAGFARIASREVPSHTDLDLAARDHAESLERLLEPGDLARLRRTGQVGEAELETRDRVRLLTHGLLLEYGADRVRVAPLLSPSLERRQAS